MAAGKSSEEMTLVYNGATVTDLSVIFDMTPPEINRRIVGKIVPVTASGKVPRYRIRDAAPYLCNVVFDIEEFLKNMSPAKLPPALQDAFWKAQRTRQEFERDKGLLWDDTRVKEVLGEVFKTFRMTVLMFTDTVEQQSELSPQQRMIIQGLGDGLLEMAHQNLVKQFQGRVASTDEHGRVLKEEVEPTLFSSDGDEATAPVFNDGFDD